MRDTQGSLTQSQNVTVAQLKVRVANKVQSLVRVVDKVQRSVVQMIQLIHSRISQDQIMS